MYMLSNAFYAWHNALIAMLLMHLHVLNTGAACVIFATHTSYIASVSSRFMQLVFGSIEKKV